MKTLKLLLISFFVLTPFSVIRAAEAPDSDALTPEEQKTADFCVANINAKTYAPDKATKCLDTLNNDPALFEKLKKTNQQGLVLILKYQNIFKELGEFYDSGPDMCETRHKLVLTLERTCAVCDLSPALGPQPDKFYPWVKDHANSALDQTRDAGLDWDKLSPDFQTTLSSYSYTQNSWKTKTVQERMASLIAGDIMNSNVPTFFDIDKSGCRVIRMKEDQFLHFYLDPGMSAKYAAYQAKLKTAGAAAAAASAAAPTTAAKTSAMSAKLGKIAPGTGGDDFAKLGTAFDGSHLSGEGPTVGPGGATGSKPAGTTDFTLSDADKVKLSGRLESSIMGEKNPDGTYSGGELKGTQSGQKLLDFFNKKNDKGEFINKLDFTVKKMDSDYTGADYCPTRCAGGCGGCTVGQIRLNSTLAETWMKKNGVTAETLLDPKNDEYVKRLARYAAPTVVHEETHQQKNREDLDNKVNESYQLDDEVRTFGTQSLFLKEKLSNPETEKLYTKDLRPFDDTVLQKIETGGYANLKKYIRYYNLHGLEGTASQEFTQYEGLLKESNLRSNDKSFVDPPNSAYCWEGDPRACSNAQLKAMQDKSFPWYQTSIKEQKANITLIDSEIARMNAIDKSGRYKKIASPVAGF